MPSTNSTENDSDDVLPPAEESLPEDDNDDDTSMSLKGDCLDNSDTERVTATIDNSEHYQPPNSTQYKNAEGEAANGVSQHAPNKPSGTNNINKFLIISCVVAILFACIIAAYSDLIRSLIPPQSASAREFITLDAIRSKFPNQNPELWAAFHAGIEDMINRNKPVTFILLYQDDDAVQSLDNIINNVTKYAACALDKCDRSPIVLTRDDYARSTIGDYGVLIDRYRDELADKHVMIVKNLEWMPGTSAQAFHAICDEFTPLVDRALIIFTMKVKRFHDNNVAFVERFLHERWRHDMKDDIFNALFVRISSMVLEIVAD